MTNQSQSIADQLNAYKDRTYEIKTIKLESPLLHIGIGKANSLSEFEYIQDDRLIYFPNQTALIDAIKRPRQSTRNRSFLDDYLNLSQQYIRIIESNDDQRDKNEKIRKLLKELKKIYSRAIDSDYLDNVDIFAESDVIDKWARGNLLKDIAPMIRNGLGEKYIPGSSIKGAIRTAIAYYLLKHQTPRVSDIERKLKDSNSKYISKSKGGFDDIASMIKINDNNLSLNDYLFSNLRINYQHRTNWHDPNHPNTDFMRAIKISDSNVLNLIEIDENNDANLSIIAEVVTSSFSQNNSRRIAKKSAVNYLEIIFDVQTEFSICIDSDMLDRFQHEQGIELPTKLFSVKGILEICQEFAQAQWKYEKNYWKQIKSNPKKKLDFSSTQDFYNQPCPFNLRLGWDSGMIGTTIGLHLQEPTREKIRNACGITTNTSESPKSRRTATIPDENDHKNLQRLPLGWCTLTIS